MSLPMCTVNTNNIQNLADAPALSSQDLKQEFDKSGKDMKEYINVTLLPAIENLVKDEKANLEASIKNKILEDNKRKYHIGKIIMSTSDTNPNKYLGFGTWVLWGSGKVPVGVDTSNDNFNAVEKTGGEETHLLTVEELASHNHMLKRTGGITGGGYNTVYTDAKGNELGFATEPRGGNKPHNNLQPYITCYMWKRTA